MDDLAALTGRAREHLAVASARLIAAQRADWQGVDAEAYRARIAEAAARVAAVERAVEASIGTPALW